MKKLLLGIIASTIVFIANSQLLSWSPPFPKEDDISQTLVITLDATKGNQGLLNYTPTNDVYVHTGVITNLSTCLLYTSDAADERSSVDLGGRRIIKKKKTNSQRP